MVTINRKTNYILVHKQLLLDKDVSLEVKGFIASLLAIDKKLSLTEIAQMFGKTMKEIKELLNEAAELGYCGVIKTEGVATEYLPSDKSCKRNEQIITPKATAKKDHLLINIKKPLRKEDVLFFSIAKSFHQLFLEKRGNTRTLMNAKYKDWIRTARQLIEIDKVTSIQLIAIKLYLEDGMNGAKGVDDFWINTIFTISALRKKSKEGVFYFDMIKEKTEKWLAQGNAERVYQAEEKLNNYIQNYDDIRNS